MTMMEHHILSGSLLQKGRPSRHGSESETTETLTLQKVIENTSKEIEEVFRARQGKVKIVAKANAA